MSNDTNINKSPDKVKHLVGTLHKCSYSYDTYGTISPVLELHVVEEDKLTNVKCTIPSEFLVGGKLSTVGLGDQIVIKACPNTDEVAVDVISIPDVSTRPRYALLPDLCPACGRPLYARDYLVTDDTLGTTCFYSGCPMRTLETINRLLIKSGVKFTHPSSYRMLHHLITRGAISSPDTLFGLTYQTILDLDSVHTDEQIVRFRTALEAHRGRSFIHFVNLLSGYGVITYDELLSVANILVPVEKGESQMDRILRFCMTITNELEYDHILLGVKDMETRSYIHALGSILLRYFGAELNGDSLCQLALWYTGANVES